jgi:hypothetical protein
MNSAILNNFETFIYGLDHDSDLSAPDLHILALIERAISHCSIDCFLLPLAHPRLALPRDITLLFVTSSTSMLSRNGDYTFELNVKSHSALWYAIRAVKGVIL